MFQASAPRYRSEHALLRNDCHLAILRWQLVLYELLKLVQMLRLARKQQVQPARPQSQSRGMRV